MGFSDRVGYIKPPCGRGENACTERKPGCHDHCDKYKKFRKELDAIKHNEQCWKDKRDEYKNYKNDLAASKGWNVNK